MTRKYVVFFCAMFFPLVGVAGGKKAYIITGPESSGSVFVSRVIAYVLGKDKFYKQWSGYGLNGKEGDDLLIFHLSQPSRSPPKFYNLSELRELFLGYELYFIVTTRDVNIVKKSKQHRFDRSESELEEHQKISRKILSEIIRNEKTFIWNYETQFYLGNSYYELLYEFLQVKTDFFPKDLFDANKKYVCLPE